MENYDTPRGNSNGRVSRLWFVLFALLLLPISIAATVDVVTSYHGIVSRVQSMVTPGITSSMKPGQVAQFIVDQRRQELQEFETHWGKDPKAMSGTLKDARETIISCKRLAEGTCERANNEGCK